MEKITLKLWSPTQAAKDLPGVWAWIKAMTVAGQRLVLEIRPEKRSDAQNRLLHALFSDVSKQAEWMGQKRTASLLDYVMSWAVEHGVELREARQWVDAETGEIIGGGL